MVKNGKYFESNFIQIKTKKKIEKPYSINLGLTRDPIV